MQETNGGSRDKPTGNASGRVLQTATGIEGVKGLAVAVAPEQTRIDEARPLCHDGTKGGQWTVGHLKLNSLKLPKTQLRELSRVMSK